MGADVSRFDEETGLSSFVLDEAKLDVSGYIEEIEEFARAARLCAEYRRVALQSAESLETEGRSQKAAELRRIATFDHKRACDHLADIAKAVRSLVRWAALDWTPTHDVAGSGLTNAELDVLCAVFGVPVPRIPEVPREVGE